MQYSFTQKFVPNIRHLPCSYEHIVYMCIYEWISLYYVILCYASFAVDIKQIWKDISND